MAYDEDALAPGDTSSFAHWMMRKLLNHDPMAKMDKLMERHKVTASYMQNDTRGTIVANADGSFDVHYQEPGGREFQITMREVPAGEKLLKRDDTLAKLRQSKGNNVRATA